MAIKITNWRPDTCACEVQYSWDDQTTEDERVHTFESLVAPCPDHQGLADEDAYNSVLFENQSTNQSLALIIQNFPALVKTITQDDGSTYDDFLPGMKPQISFGPLQDVSAPLQQKQNNLQKGVMTPQPHQPSTQARQINFSMPSLQQSDKDNCQSILDSQIGSGVVVVS